MYIVYLWAYFGQNLHISLQVLFQRPPGKGWIRTLIIVLGWNSCYWRRLSKVSIHIKTLRNVGLLHCWPGKGWESKNRIHDLPALYVKLCIVVGSGQPAMTKTCLTWEKPAATVPTSALGSTPAQAIKWWLWGNRSLLHPDIDQKWRDIGFLGRNYIQLSDQMLLNSDNSDHSQKQFDLWSNGRNIE